MYAIISCGGKQYKVSVGDVINVEKLEQQPNTTLTLPALLVSDDKGVTLGHPTVDGVVVSATVLEQGKGEKVAENQDANDMQDYACISKSCAS